jgi:hypothetical protein
VFSAAIQKSASFVEFVFIKSFKNTPLIYESRPTHTILPMVSYGCETWSLTLKEDHRPRVFGNKMLSIFGRRRDDGENCISRM